MAFIIYVYWGFAKWKEKTKTVQEANAIVKGQESIEIRLARFKRSKQVKKRQQGRKHIEDIVLHPNKL